MIFAKSLLIVWLSLLTGKWLIILTRRYIVLISVSALPHYHRLSSDAPVFQPPTVELFRSLLPDCGTLPPQNVTSAPSLTVFRKLIFNRSFLQSPVIAAHFEHYYRFCFLISLLPYFLPCYMCPEYLRTIVEPATPSHPVLHSAACSAPKFVVPRLRTKFSERAFSFSGPVAWNSLPADIRCTTNRQTFKTL